MSAYSMSPEHKNMLRSNRVFLVKNIKTSETLLSSLEASKVLSEDMKEEIMSLLYPTKRDKAGAILDLLPKRGPTAFENFIKALMESDHEHVAQMLDSQLANKYATSKGKDMDVDENNFIPIAPPGVEMAETVDIPTEIAEGNLMKMELIEVDLSHQWTKQVLAARDHYPFGRATRGRALIICNEYFTAMRLPTREGAQSDKANIDTLLGNLGFNTRLVENKNSRELKEILEQESKSEIHQNADAFIIFIMSHGTQGKIYCIDGEKLSITDDIASKFDGKNCPALKNKPKIIFVQACQGSAVTSGYGQDQPDSKQTSHLPEADQRKIEELMGELRIQDTRESVPSLSHEKADFLFAYATVPGYRAWRHHELGSWFVRTIVYVFSKYAHRETLTDLLTKVRSLMSKMKTMHTDEHFIQITETRDTLLKKVYLFPGYIEGQVV